MPVQSKLALHGGDPVRTRPFEAWPPRDEPTEKALVEVYRSGRWGSGDEVQRFERDFASFVGARYGVAVSSGTAALEIALRAIGVDSGSEVIVPAYTFFSTASAVLRANAIPVFVDIDPLTYTMDPGEVEAKITDKTRAIIPVHLFGYPMDIEALRSVSASRGIRIVEDCAHALGAARGGRMAGAFGDMSIFSFMSSKLMTAGEGGIILTSSKELAVRSQSLRDCGRLPGKSLYEHHLLGSNNRLTEFQAAILNRQLDRAPERQAKRASLAKELCRRLDRIEGLRVGQPREEEVDHAWLCVAVAYDRDAFHGVPLELFCMALQKEGIPCEPGYDRPVYRNPIFLKRTFDRNQCPVGCPFYGRDLHFHSIACPIAERLCEGLFLIPHHLLYEEDEVADDIVSAICKVKENALDLIFETEFARPKPDSL